jgi:orotidine-5'-phosphate decarboxylase
MRMATTISPTDRLIVALDVDTREESKALTKTLGEAVTFYKVGLQLFMGSGLIAVRDLLDAGKKVFLDLKIDDTPRTVKEAVRNVAREGVEFFTLQGNTETARAAAEGRGASPRPRFLQVTYLSSWDAADLREQLGGGAEAVDFDERVVSRARRILEAGGDGVIASGTSVAQLRKAIPQILIVTPGIRPSGAATDDHKRSLTPGDAIRAGADYLVVGRPIRSSDDPRGTARRIQDEIAAALPSGSAERAATR